MADALFRKDIRRQKRELTAIRKARKPRNKPPGYLILPVRGARYPGVLSITESGSSAPLVVQDIFSIIREINRQGVTVLLVEQNANMALKIADLAYVLETGTITMSGTGAELLADSRVKEAYLGKSS